MKKNLYYRAVSGRKNSIKDMIGAFFYGLSGYPRILLEVFIRKNFGERYFTLSAASVNFIVLFFIPFFMDMIPNRGYYGGSDTSFGDVILKNITWYLFLATYIYFCILRWKEIKKSKRIYDFTRYSLSDGTTDPRLSSIKINGKQVDNRTLETLIEPAFFFVIGVILLICVQKIGLLLILASIIYSLSYYYAYRHGDNFVLDKIDEMISIKNMYKSFVDGLNPDETDGFKTRGERPKDAGYRRKLVEEMIVDDDDDDNFAV